MNQAYDLDRVLHRNTCENRTKLQGMYLTGGGDQTAWLYKRILGVILGEPAGVCGSYKPCPYLSFATSPGVKGWSSSLWQLATSKCQRTSEAYGTKKENFSQRKCSALVTGFWAKGGLDLHSPQSLGAAECRR